MMSHTTLQNYYENYNANPNTENMVHSGPAGRGHYTAFARGPTESTWHYYDDSCEPRATTSANVLAAQAYLLVYEQA